MTLALALTLLGLLLTLLLAALDQTIVATALPRITQDLGGFDHYTWVTTAYLVTSTVMVPIAGKLSDQLGRKPLLTISTAAFLLSSLLCGQAQTFEQLVGARAFQGLSGGAITAAVFATVPTLFSPQSRARIIGLFTGTYGLASIIGPLIGGLVTDSFGWRGVFFLNLPVGAVALGLVAVTFHPRPQHAAHASIDYLGGATLMLGTAPLLLALSLGGHELAWSSPALLTLLAAGLVLLGVFARIETRAAQPVLPLNLLRSRSVGVSSLGMVFMSATLFATALFTPLFVQSVIGASATGSGSVLAPMMLAFVVASIVVGQVLARFPRYRLVGMFGLLLASSGQLLMAGMGASTDYLVVARNLVVIGFGLGSALAAFVVAGQNAVPLTLMGVATALGTFARATGATLSSAAFGSLLAFRLTASNDLAGALHDTFFASAVAVGIGALVVMLLRVGQAPGLIPLAAYGSKPAEDRRAGRLDELLGNSTGN
jgi:EmrB/QacA subfamily drug resistance transporter